MDFVVPAEHLVRDSDRMNLVVLQRIDRDVERVGPMLLPCTSQVGQARG